MLGASGTAAPRAAARGSWRPGSSATALSGALECVGGEICIARQDLVIALDCSGSLKQEGFDIVWKLTLHLTSRHRGAYRSVKDMRIGLALLRDGGHYVIGTIALDGSGSRKQEGFATVQELYQGTYHSV